VPLLGQVPLEGAVSAGGDRGRPVALDADAPEGSAAHRFAEIAERLNVEVPVTEPVDGPDMAGCSARMLAAVEVALGESV